MNLEGDYFQGEKKLFHVLDSAAQVHFQYAIISCKVNTRLLAMMYMCLLESSAKQTLSYLQNEVICCCYCEVITKLGEQCMWIYYIFSKAHTILTFSYSELNFSREKSNKD